MLRKRIPVVATSKKLFLAAITVCGVLLIGLGVRGGGEDRDWRWPDRLSQEQIAELTLLRSQYRGELAALGPSPGERLTSIQLSTKQRADIRQAVHDLPFRRRPGSGHLVQVKRRDDLIRAYGIVAVPYLCEALPLERYWSARLAAQALGILAGGARAAEVRWLAIHFQAPSDLIEMFGSGPEHELTGLNVDLNAALGVLVDPELARRLDGDLGLSQRATTQQALHLANLAQAAWRSAWRDAYRDWLSKERELTRMRRDLERKLDLLRQGIDPERTVPRNPLGG